MLLLRFVLSFIILFGSIASNAQVFRPLFKNYNTKDGLPSSRIYQIKQDQRGYMWIATDNGVSRFDGNSFTNFTYSDGLCVQTLFGIYEDQQDRIWFYSFSGELIYYDYKDHKMHCPTFNKNLLEYTKGLILNGVVVEGDTAYTIDYQGNVFKVNLQTDEVSLEVNLEGQFKFKRFKSGDHLFGFLNSKKGSGVEFHLSEHGNSKKVQQFKIKDTISRHTIPSSIYSQQEQSYYLTAKSGLLKYSPIENKLDYFPLSFKNTQSIEIDEEGLIWLGSFSNGVFAFDASKDDMAEKHNFLKEYMVTSVLQDKNGSFWFATHDNGIFYSPHLGLEEFTSEAENQFTSSSQILVLKNGDQSVFFSNAKGEVIKLLDDGIGSVELVGKENRNFDRLFVRNDEYIKMDASTPFFNEDKNRKITLRSYLKGPNKSIALFTHGENIGVFTEEDGFYIEKYILQRDDRKFRNMQVTPSGDFYLSNNYKLWFYNSTSKEWNQLLKNSSDYPALVVTSISHFAGDSVIVTTRDRGILLVYKDSVLASVSRADGFPVDYCNQAFIDWPYLYVATNEGLIRIKDPFSKAFSFERFDKNSGLPSNEVFASLRFKSKVYISTNDGLCRLDTQLFTKPTRISECIIESVVFNGKSVPVDSSLSFSQNEGELTITYVANSFVNAMNIPFRYRFKKENPWIYTFDNHISISNLGPSEYQFEVQAANANEEWGKAGVYLFSIEPMFWQTPWFLGVSILLTLIIASLIFWWRLQQANKLNRLQSMLVKSQNRALSAQMNPHFIFNSLNSISHGLLNNDTRTSVLFIGKFAKLMRTIFENSEETFITLNEELSALSNYLELEKLRLQEKLEYEIKMDDSIQGNQIFVPALLLQPFVENAIWHGIAPLTSSNGKIEVILQQEKEYLIITIEDNGVGLSADSNNKQKSSLQTTEKRLKLIEKIYKRKIIFSMNSLLPNDPQSGTKILLSIPIIKVKP